MNAVLARKVVGVGGRLFAFVAMLGSVPMNGAEPTATVPDLAPLVQANNRFACDLYGKLRSEKGNLFFSPSSIFTALDMTTAGAARRDSDANANRVATAFGGQCAGRRSISHGGRRSD